MRKKRWGAFGGGDSGRDGDKRFSCGMRLVLKGHISEFRGRKLGESTEGIAAGGGRAETVLRMRAA